MKLYEITGGIFETLQEVASADGEITDEQLKRLDILECAKEEKLDNCGKLIREWQANLEAVDAEVARLKNRAAALERAIERLKEYVGGCLGVGNKCKTKLFSWYWRESARVVVDDPSMLPREYQRLKIEANTPELRRDLEIGAEVHGARLERKNNICLR